MADPALSFYYGTHLTHRERWPLLSSKQKAALIRLHASRQWESYCRRVHKGSGRYWEGNTELDLVAFQAGSKRLLVAECKWQDLSPAEEKGLLERLRLRFAQTRLAASHRDAGFSLKLQGAHLDARSNMKFEKAYRYNYTSRNYFVGFGYTYQVPRDRRSHGAVSLLFAPPFC